MKRLMGGVSAACVLCVSAAIAGGNPEFVEFPKGYTDSFTNYATLNRAGKPLVAKMWANDAAVASYKQDGKAASGSVVIMEIYKPKKGQDGKPVAGDGGVYEIDKLAAVAVMRRADNWDGAYAESDRLAGWGFAIFNPDGTPKKNDLNCVECHTPLSGQDYLFSYAQLKDYATKM